MKTAIVFASRHGTTAKVAHLLKNGLEYHNTDIYNLKVSDKIDLGNYDCIIIGGSIHAGRLQKNLKKFCKKHQEILLNKPLGIFLCCMDETLYETQFDNSFPEILRKHAKSRKIMGGEFLLEKMNFWERFIIKMGVHITESVSSIDQRKIEEMISEMRN